MTDQDVLQYRFGGCTLDVRKGELTRDGEGINLRPKVFALLQFLVENRDRLVTKDEVMEHVWEGRIISEATINSCIRELRTAVGDTDKKRRMVRTIHGRGFRFVGHILVDKARPGFTPGGPAGGATRGAGSGAARGPVGPGEPPSELNTNPDPILRPRTATPPAAGPFAAAPASSARASSTPSSSMPSAGASAVRPGPPDRASKPTPPPFSERKQVTALSCTLTGIDPEDPDIGAEAAHEIHRRFMELSVKVVERYGGTVYQDLENGMLAVFGVPVAHEDDTRRAALAGMELATMTGGPELTAGAFDELDLPPTRPPIAAVSAAVTFGQVLVGYVGKTRRLSLTSWDGCLERAAVISPRVPAGGVLVGEAALTHLPGAKTERYDQDGPMVEGGGERSRRLHRLFELHPVHPVEDRSEHGLSPFIGRVAELATLRGLLDDAAEGRGHAVSLSGPAGIGKTRLLTEFRRELVSRGFTYLRGRCVSFGQVTPLLPVAELVGERCGTTDMHRNVAAVARLAGLDDLSAKLLAVVAGLPVDPSDLASLSPQELKLKTFEATREVFARGLDGTAVVLEIEDLHWVDPTTEEWLSYMAAHLSTAPVLLLTTYRPGYRPPWLDRSNATQLSLRPLKEADSRALIESVMSLAGSPPETLAGHPVVDKILRRAGGNPFFLEELSRSVAADLKSHTASAEQSTGFRTPEVPESVRAVLTARMDRLHPGVKRLLQAAAVTGRDVSLGLLKAVSDLDENTLRARLDVLVNEEFLAEHGPRQQAVLSFRHALTRDAAYHSLLARTLRELHLRVAQALTTLTPEIAHTRPELLAHHLTEGGQKQKAIALWHSAAEMALARSAPREAARLARQALKLTTELPAGDERDLMETALRMTEDSAEQMSRS